MAKMSKIVANVRRRRTVARYAQRRAALKEAVRTASAFSPPSAGCNQHQLSLFPVKVR